MTWKRSPPTDNAPGRALIIRQPRIALTFWRADGTYAVTGHAGRTQAGMTLGAVLDWCSDNGIPKPPDADLAWMEYRT